MQDIIAEESGNYDKRDLKENYLLRGSKHWHDQKNHLAMRIQVTRTIISMIQDRCVSTNASSPLSEPVIFVSEWMEAAAAVADRVEKGLYTAAKSFSDYIDKNTLLDRIQVIVLYA